MNNPRNGAFSNRVGAGDSSDALAFGVPTTNRCYLPVRQFGATVCGPGWVHAAPLAFHVCDVIALRPYEQVSRVDAKAVVASVAHDHADWYFANEQGVGKAVCKPKLPHRRADAVPIASLGSGPNKALVTGYSLCKKAALERSYVKAIVSSPLHAGYCRIYS